MHLRWHKKNLIGSSPWFYLSIKLEYIHSDGVPYEWCYLAEGVPQGERRSVSFFLCCFWYCYHNLGLYADDLQMYLHFDRYYSDFFARQFTVVQPFLLWFTAHNILSLPSKAEIKTFNTKLWNLFTGGYYTIEQSHSKLRIVVLNSVLWAGGAVRTDAPHRGKAQWEWLEQVLSKARRKNEMVSWIQIKGWILFRKQFS